MRVLFIKPVTPYHSGDVADVAEGYAKNFLIPQNLAVPASAHAIAEAQQRKQKHVAADADAEHDLDALAKALNGKTVHVEAKAATTGTLYAAVNSTDITKAIAQQIGYALPPALQKQLPTLKHTGKHPVTLQIHATTVTFSINI
ncbi:MAG: 50S ribosomal protein L9 [Patescibacteria group bacterium]